MSAPEPRLAVHQFSREEAIEFAQTGRWKPLSPKERALVQLRQECLCMDFSAFHEGITELLGRPVYTHEFADPDRLWEEYHRGEPIGLDEILAKLPAHLKPIVVIVDQGGDA
ncbi:hypothetical protein GG804_10265 [Sphingomonas histidinilytica]|uniref:DUF7736 domain-containing protein n=1 Tax=Rhizorhabdus wittichii TaxID=160791 RepID=A0A975CYL2_9SPHN|nr:MULTISPECIES: hypothetical protein [Rhizorhabdus]MBO9377152.1 hypothetical protein [Rhizorhabdus histidinilytica]QEH79971.1 hypothetical protein EIK56_18265 [Sphingomonas sp. C8-2]QTH19698.1 hypothetical protein HRJ34_15100 [Rhizorhabdus wittichii]